MGGIDEPPRVTIRSTDGGVIEGEIVDFSLDRAEFELRSGDDSFNCETAVLPLGAVTFLVMHRFTLERAARSAELRRVVLHFRDGDTLRGFVRSPPQRFQYGMLVELILPTRQDVEVLAVPYEGLQALAYVKEWDGPTVEFAHGGIAGDTDTDQPLISLIGSLRRLDGRRRRGEVSRDEYGSRRRRLIDRM